jgi:hypothetical protein
MRKGFDGLAALVQTALAANSFCGHAFVFCGRRGDCARPINPERRVSDKLIGAFGGPLGVETTPRRVAAYGHRAFNAGFPAINPIGRPSQPDP